MVEGAGLVTEALAAGASVEVVYLPAGTTPPPEVLAAGVPVVELLPGVLERVATTVTPQPLLAVVACGDVTLERLRGASFLVVGVGLADPGNVGTILRTVEAAGADGVVLTAGSVDPFNPKVVRASAGAVFHVPIVVRADLAAIGELGVALLGTAASGGVAYDEVSWEQPFALVLGNEAHGLAPHDLARLDGLVTVPHVGRAESLNVAMAAAVCCFEAARQRRLAERAVGGGDRGPSGQLAPR